MSRQSPRHPRRVPAPQRPPAREREITIRPQHLVIAGGIVLVVIVGLLVVLPRLLPATPASAPVPGSAAVQAPPPGVAVEVPAGQVVLPSGAGRVDSTPEGFPSEGRADAPITILNFSDFQCPYCRIFATDTLPQLREKWIQTGQARVIWRDLAIRGPESETAGAAALCAHEQGRFWPYHDLLYARQQGQNEGTFSVERLKAYAAEVGRIHPQVFAQCLDSGRYLAAVRASTQDGQKTLGLTGTPTFFVNGKKVEGALDWPTWDEMLSVAAQP